MRYVTEYFKQPLVSSAPLAWEGVRVEQHRLEAGELPAHHHKHHLLMLYQAAVPLVVHQLHETRTTKTVYHTGDLGLYPGGDYSTLTWTTPHENVYLMVDDQHLDRLVRQGLDLTHFVLSERLKFNDPFLAQLCRQLLAAAGSQHALGLLYVESLTNALCYHLIQYHAAHERRIATGGRLTREVLARIDDYLEAHAEAPVTLDILAGLANLSVFHFARLFKQTMGVAPYQYVLGWKIRRARQLLRLGHASVADISDVLGFASLATFSTAFKRAVGCSPQEFQRGGASDKR
ncbi:helix-turn-helix transcriptional regulator [Hymenobacter bucti]|uniref:Helix-turn-helix transcriptional regulator n=1 Tax=Hymenobacter bucti TaxID=1844114 RepID=A0ABW4R0W1_9BACT